VAKVKEWLAVNKQRSHRDSIRRVSILRR
jgi:hypothetical protein